MKPQRIDPDGCGCTDCMVGYSIPLQIATPKQLKLMRKGKIDNATGLVVKKTVTYTMVRQETPQW